MRNELEHDLLKEMDKLLSSERTLLRDKNTVTLFGEIDSITAIEFVHDFTLLSYQKEPVHLIIASNGGEVESGLACIRAIQTAQKKGIKVIGHVYGHAMSMAFLILQTCDERYMGQGCILMAHGITSFHHGDIKNLESERKLITFWANYFAKELTKRCKNTEQSYWEKILADSNPQYYTSREALELGIIDGVEGSSEYSQS